MKVQLLVVSLLLAFVLASCSRRSGHPAGVVADEAPSGSKQRVGAPSPAADSPHPSEGVNVLPYPAARWRLASFEALDRATLWVGQIVIRHELSQPEGMRAPGWHPDGPNPKRSSAAALAIADQLHRRLVQAPEEFESLAREHSEDPVTKDIGGFLGGVRASQLTGADILDALATLRPGEVSRPFQTPYGVHLLKRYPPPKLERLAGERVVIGYEGVFGLGRIVTRGRDEARALAEEIADRAVKDPTSFRALVAEYSDNVDRAIAGDMGVFSTHDPGYLPLEVDALSRLSVGQVTGPIDSRIGFQVLRRVPVVPHEEYAMTAVEVPLDMTLPDEATAMNRALAEVAMIQKVLGADPRRFSELQLARRSQAVRRWTFPQGDLGLTRTLDGLSVGHIAPEPVRHGSALLVVKRLDPKSLPPEPPRLTELPSPTDPDYDALIEHNSGAQLAAALRAFVGELRRANAGITPKAVEMIAGSFDELGTELEQSGPDVVTARDKAHATLASLKRRLDAGDFSKLAAEGRRWVVEQMMPPEVGAAAKARND